MQWQHLRLVAVLFGPSVRLVYTSATSRTKRAPVVRPQALADADRPVWFCNLKSKRRVKVGVPELNLTGTVLVISSIQAHLPVVVKAVTEPLQGSAVDLKCSSTIQSTTSKIHPGRSGVTSIPKEPKARP
jgi:hypothetical protein